MTIRLKAAQMEAVLDQSGSTNTDSVQLDDNINVLNKNIKRNLDPFAQTNHSTGTLNQF